MLSKKTIYEKALQQIKQRRQTAMARLQLRLQEIEEKVPAVVQLQNEVASTSIRLSKLLLHTKEPQEQQRILQNLMRENLNTQQQIIALLGQYGYPENYLTVQYTCPTCSDTGYVNGNRCTCLMQIVKQLTFEDFSQSTAMSACRFEGFRLDYYSKVETNSTGQSYYDVMSRILTFCKEYADTFTLRSPSILMVGNTGLGKTHLSLSIANRVIERGYSVLYTSAAELFPKLQNEYFGKLRADNDTYALLMEPDLLILDDLGAEFDSSFHATGFYNILNGRTKVQKPTLICTGLTLPQLQQRYSDRIASRLLTGYQCLKFVGKDIRTMRLS